MKRTRDKTAKPNREAAIILHLDGLSPTEIASRLGVSRQTVWRWLNATAAAKAIDAELRERRQRARRRSEALQSLAVQAMTEVLENRKHPDRWKAARAVLDLAIRRGDAFGGNQPAEVPPCTACAERAERDAAARRGLSEWLTRLPTPEP